MSQFESRSQTSIHACLAACNGTGSEVQGSGTLVGSRAPRNQSKHPQLEPQHRHGHAHARHLVTEQGVSSMQSVAGSITQGGGVNTMSHPNGCMRHPVSMYSDLGPVGLTDNVPTRIHAFSCLGSFCTRITPSGPKLGPSLPYPIPQGVEVNRRVEVLEESAAWAAVIHAA